MSAIGPHHVLEPAGVLPQAAARLDASPAIGPDEVRSMATPFSAAAPGAAGPPAGVTMLIGDGHVPGHAGRPRTCCGPSRAYGPRPTPRLAAD